MIRRIVSAFVVGLVVSTTLVATSKATSHLKVGVHEKWRAPDNGRTPAQVKARFPGSDVGRAFVNGVQSCSTDLRPKVDSVLAPYFTATTDVVYVSVKTNPTQTIAGECNTEFRQLGSHLMLLRARHPRTEVRFIWYHEPEDDLTARQFASGFRIARTQVQLAGPIKVVYSSMAWQWRPGSRTTSNVASWKVRADEYTSDVYSGRSYDLRFILPEHPGFVRWLQELVGNRPYGITERGFETPSSTNRDVRNDLRNQAISREFDWLKNSPEGRRCQVYIYWNSSGTEESQGLRLDPTGESVLAGEIANL